MTLPILIYSEARTGLKLTLDAVSTLFIAGTILLVLAMELLRSRR